jgi:hypothetical protein
MEAREAAVMFQGFNVLRSVTRLDFDMKHADYEQTDSRSLRSMAVARMKENALLSGC